MAERRERQCRRSAAAGGAAIRAPKKKRRTRPARRVAKAEGMNTRSRIGGKESTIGLLTFSARLAAATRPFAPFPLSWRREAREISLRPARRFVLSSLASSFGIRYIRFTSSFPLRSVPLPHSCPFFLAFFFVVFGVQCVRFECGGGSLDLFSSRAESRPLALSAPSPVQLRAFEARVQRVPVSLGRSVGAAPRVGPVFCAIAAVLAAPPNTREFAAPTADTGFADSAAVRAKPVSIAGAHFSPFFTRRISIGTCARSSELRPQFRFSFAVGSSPNTRPIPRPLPSSSASSPCAEITFAFFFFFASPPAFASFSWPFVLTPFPPPTAVPSPRTRLCEICPEG